MPVEVRYHVIREGKEIAVYTTKKEADAHDKMLDIAEELSEFISQAETINIEEDALEELCIYLSKNRDRVVRLLKGIKRPSKPSKTATSSKDKVELPQPEKSKSGSAAKPQKGQSKTSKPLTTVKKKTTSTLSKKSRKVAGSKR